MIHGDAHGPVTADLLEVQRWVFGISLQQLVRFVSQRANRSRQAAIALPEFGTCVVFHRSVQRPSRKSLIASSVSASRRPAETSSSIWPTPRGGVEFGEPLTECRQFRGRKVDDGILDLLDRAHAIRISGPEQSVQLEERGYEMCGEFDPPPEDMLTRAAGGPAVLAMQFRLCFDQTPRRALLAA